MINQKNSTSSINHTRNLSNATADSIGIRHTIKLPVDKYEISVVVDNFGRFVSIDSIRISKQFFSPLDLRNSHGKTAEELLDEYIEQDD